MSDANAETAMTIASLQDLLNMGGPAMVVLVALSIAGLAAALYTFALSALSAPRRSRRIDEAVSRWCQGDIDGAQQRLANQRNPLAGLLSYAMDCRRRGQSADSAREELARRAQRLVAPFESPLKIMEVVAALAPLVGLLGTVMGMMTAFNTMAGADGQASPAQLSGGIYEALTTTAAGLVIAIPFAALSAWLEFWLRRVQQHINDYLVRIFQAPTPNTREAMAQATEGTGSTAPSDTADAHRHHAMA